MALKRKAAKKAYKKSAPKKKAAKKAIPRRGAVKKKSGGNCYFTTACCEYYNLSDNCYQLKTLRKFRDNVMLATSKGKQLVKLYYEVAPQIVEKVKKDKDHPIIFKMIFEHVNKSCLLISQRENHKAIVEYKRMVQLLIEKYL